MPIPFIEKTLQAGAAQYFDIMNIHPYAMSSIPEKTKEQVDPLFKLFEKYKLKKHERFIIYTKDLFRDDDITFLPIYMTMFL